MGYGEPCEDNVWDIIDGKWIFDKEIMDATKKNELFHNTQEKYGGTLYNISGAGQLLEDPRIDPGVTRVSIYDFWPVDASGGFLDPGVNICWGNYKTEPWDATLYQVSYDPKDDISIINQTIKDSLVVEWMKMITAETEEACVAQFEKSKSELNAKGLDKLTEYNQSEFQKNSAKLNG
jgi:hypothetical protein